MDGEITIGTKLDTDKFDRQISDLEKKMQKEEDKKIVIDAKLGSQQEDLEKANFKTISENRHSIRHFSDMLDLFLRIFYIIILFVL